MNFEITNNYLVCSDALFNANQRDKVIQEPSEDDKPWIKYVARHTTLCKHSNENGSNINR